MRISEKTTAILTSLVKKHFGSSAELRLFGSRLNDQARGGDIDLHVIAPDSSYRDEIAFLVDVEQMLDERVDIRVQRHEKLLIDELAMQSGALLTSAKRV